MKKFVSTLLLIGMLAFVPTMPTEAAAGSTPSGESLAESTEFAACPRGTYRVRRNTRTKKRLVNSLIAGGIGAAIGGGIGGGRGALLGAGSGAGGYLIYRYVRDRRGRCVPRLVR